MLARLLIPICVCCVVLCTFVGFLSKRAIEEAGRITTQPLKLECNSFINSPPKKSTGVLLSNFVFVDRIATIDNDGDNRWDEVAIPLFSPHSFDSKVGYSAVIACFRDVPDMETLHQRLAPGELQTNFCADEQNLRTTLHTQLATKFKNMDFRNSPVVTIGYGQDNPLLGETSLKYSYFVGTAAVGVGGLTLAYLVTAGLCKHLQSLPRSSKESRRKPTKNRAGLPGRQTKDDAEPTGGVLDQVQSLRQQQVHS